MRTKSVIVPGVVAVAVAMLALVLANHRSRSSSAVATGKSAAVAIENYAFMPQSLTVKTGTRVSWTNRDSTAHTATANQNSLDSGTINPGQRKTILFTHPGTYAYHCAFHAFMTGTIRVVQ